MARLTNNDRLRYVEAMVSDEVVPLYLISQRCQSRQELDARNSTERAPTFHEKLSSLFNNEAWIPYTTSYPTLHQDYALQFQVPKGDLNMTPEKSKEILAAVKPTLYQIIYNYEASGQGGLHRKVTSPDWGTFSIEDCNGKDDRAAFLRDHQPSYLLYWWARLDEYQLLSFTCAHLSNAITADANRSPNPNEGKNRSSFFRKSANAGLYETVENVGMQMGRIAKVELENSLASLEDSKLDYELKLEDISESTDKRKHTLYNRRIKKLNEQISSIMLELDRKPLEVLEEEK